MSIKQDKARVRNWNKARVIGFKLNTSGLTPAEIRSYENIRTIQKKLLAHWDINTERHLGIKLPPYKCEICGKRSSKNYSGNYRTLCRECSKNF